MGPRKKNATAPPAPVDHIAQSILLIRDQKVMLDADLADLYDVDTRPLIQAVRRNMDRFPADFMFRLTKPEFDGLRSQFVISNRGGRRYSLSLALGSVIASSSVAIGLPPWSANVPSSFGIQRNNSINY